MSVPIQLGIEVVELGIIHGCCKANRESSKNKSSADVREEGRKAAAYLGVGIPKLPYYTCTLSRLGPAAGHKLDLPLDCTVEREALTNLDHDDSAYEEWLAELELESSGVPHPEGTYPFRSWRDVHVYLDHRDTRPPVWDEVMTQLPEVSYVLAGHSLGSIIAIDLIREGRTKPSALVTIGSPLGLPGITRWVPRMQLSIPWVNVVDERDWVTLRRRRTPKSNGFGGDPYRDVWVDNPQLDGDHDLIGYLSQQDAIVAIQPLLLTS